MQQLAQQPNFGMLRARGIRYVICASGEEKRSGSLFWRLKLEGNS
jgi:hypothetical protein